MAVNGWDFKAAAREIEKHVGTAPAVKIRQGPNVEEVKAEINRIWVNALPLAAVDEAADWWRVRVGHVPPVKDLRATPALRCPGAAVYPAMLALVRGSDGKPVNMHRTYLGPGGTKAPVDEPRRVMPLPMPKGCAVRLGPVGPVLGIAEGIETAMAASVLHDVPVWAALNTVCLEGWEPPEGPRIIVFGDNDGNFAGQAAAFGLAKKLRAKRIEVEVMLPPAPGMDWNDVWNATTPKTEADMERVA
jgi:putative DNA primase/helicase